MRDRKIISSPEDCAPTNSPLPGSGLGLGRGQSSWDNFPCTTFMYLFIFHLSLTPILKNIKCYSVQLVYGYGTTANSKLRTQYD